MRRKRLRWAILVLVFVALGALVYQLATSLEAQKQREVDESPLAGMLPQAVQWIQNFHRVEVRDGRKAWEVEAEEAQYLEDTEQVYVRAPSATFYMKDDEKVTVRGGEGKLHLKDRDLQTVVLHDNVEIHVRSFIIRVEDARYDRSLDRITSKGPVSIVSDEVEVKGTGMIVFMKDSRFELLEGVRVTLQARGRAS